MTMADEGAEATPAAEAGAEATPEGSPEGSESGDAVGGETEQRKGAHFSDGYADADVAKQAARYNTPEDMAKALRAANTELSTRLKIPGKDADADTIANFNKKMGVPTSIEGYEVSRPDFLPEPMWASPQVQAPLTAMVTKMHEAGASKKVVDAVLAGYWDMETQNRATLSKNDEDNISAADAHLREKWDSDYEANMGFAKVSATQYPDLAQLELKDGSLVGSSPYFAELLSTFGRQNSEGGVQAGFANSEAGVDMKARYDELTGEISDAYNLGDKAKANALDAQRQKISVKLHGNAPVLSSS